MATFVGNDVKEPYRVAPSLSNGVLDIAKEKQSRCDSSGGRLYGTPRKILRQR